MMRSLRVHQYIDFLGARSSTITRMIVRHGTTLWAIATLVLLASVSLSESVKVRKPRRRITTRAPYQRSRIGPVIIRVMHKYPDDGFTSGASVGCTGDNCRNTHDKFNIDINEAISEKDNFLSDEKSLRYVVHPEKYEHFVLRKNTGHANRYKRDSSGLHSSNASDHAVVDHSGDARKYVNKGNFTRVPLYRIDRYKRDSSGLHSSNATDRTVVDCGDARKNVNKGNFTRVPLHRIDRYKRDSSGLHSSNVTERTVVDDGDVIKASRNVNKGNFTRVPLYRIDRYTRDFSQPLSQASRTRRRSLPVDYSYSRRNDSYYAERKAVMERYYARQREINARYANRTSGIPRTEHNDVSQHRPATSNATLFNLGRVYSTARDSVTFRYPSIKIDPIYSNESRYNKIPTELDSRRNVEIPETDLGFKSDAVDLSQTRSSANIERNALDYFVTPTPCTNLSSSGTFAPKTKLKHAKNCTGQNNEDCDHGSTDNDNIEGNLRWGRCEGKIVYQHNLLLGLTGPSNLDALFEVIIQGPVCVTCVEALRYNATRATVTLDSGGRGHEYAKLRLQGYENEGFSYIIKVWGIKKTGQVCDNIN
ncbi:PREDICTED: uncharacterized protein LOC105453071 [Wasmannia auropunctata]|uniref:uncharacterized protein LOC105453071 n=1 Tax=Wasmannia auropunctata TaxID=64793 RepID=UPI0005EF9BC1|nr:PREDICTED: uncharacterized protein LOC105453071 [Wasmannia auropunctata]